MQLFLLLRQYLLMLVHVIGYYQPTGDHGGESQNPLQQVILHDPRENKPEGPRSERCKALRIQFIRKLYLQIMADSIVQRLQGNKLRLDQLLDPLIHIPLLFLQELLYLIISQHRLNPSHRFYQILHLVLIYFPNRLADVHFLDYVFGVINPVQGIALPALPVTILVEYLRELVQGFLRVLILRVEHQVVVLGEDGDHVVLDIPHRPGQLIQEPEDLLVVHCVSRHAIHSVYYAMDLELSFLELGEDCLPDGFTVGELVETGDVEDAEIDFGLLDSLGGGFVE